MVSKLILLLGIILATALTYFCIQDNKVRLTQKYATVTTNSSAQKKTTISQEITPTKDNIVSSTTNQVQEKSPIIAQPAAQSDKNITETKPVEKVAINKPEFFYSTDKEKILKVNMNPSNKTLAFVDLLDTLCPNEACDKNITFSDKTASKPWDESIIKIATFLNDHNVKNGSISLKEQSIKITGIFEDNATLEKFQSLLQPLGKGDFQITNKTQLVQKSPSLDDIQRNINITLHNKPIYFHTNSDKLLRKSKKTLDEIINMINDSNLTLSFVVAGHTDASGKATYNKYLSQKRANSVRRYLMEHKLKAKTIEAIGWGEEKPITANPYKKENRRVEIEIKKESK